MAGRGPERQRERERIGEALVALIGERGYAETTLDALLERAGVERATFELHFADLEACFAEVWEGCKAEVVGSTSGACRDAGGWRKGARAAAWELCRWAQENPLRARILFVELLAAGEMVRASRDLTISVYSDLIHRGRLERPQAAEVPRERAEAIIGAIWERLANAAGAGELELLPRVVPEMMYVVVFPYLDTAAAREELRRGPDDIARYRRGEL